MSSKGPLGELELRDKLEALLGISGLTCGDQRWLGADKVPDVRGVPGWWVECKRVERPSFGKWLVALMGHVVLARTKKRPMLCWRKNRGLWWAVIRLDDWAALVRELWALRRENEELRAAIGVPPRPLPQHEPRQVTLDEVT